MMTRILRDDVIMCFWWRRRLWRPLQQKAPSPFFFTSFERRPHIFVSLFWKKKNFLSYSSPLLKGGVRSVARKKNKRRRKKKKKRRKRRKRRRRRKGVCRRLVSFSFLFFSLPFGWWWSHRVFKGCCDGESISIGEEKKKEVLKRTFDLSSSSSGFKIRRVKCARAERGRRWTSNRGRFTSWTNWTRIKTRRRFWG